MRVRRSGQAFALLAASVLVAGCLVEDGRAKVLDRQGSVHLMPADDFVLLAQAHGPLEIEYDVQADAGIRVLVLTMDAYLARALGEPFAADGACSSPSAAVEHKRSCRFEKATAHVVLEAPEDAGGTGVRVDYDVTAWGAPVPTGPLPSCQATGLTVHVDEPVREGVIVEALSAGSVVESDVTDADGCADLRVGPGDYEVHAEGGFALSPPCGFAAQRPVSYPGGRMDVHITLAPVDGC